MSAKMRTVTAGNSSGINDGSAALLITSKETIDEYEPVPRAHIVATACAGVEPSSMKFGSVAAVKKALKLARLSMDELSVIELNEAFAS